MSDPATKQDLDNAIKELKLYIWERESVAIKWIMGIQVTYFALVLGVVYFATHK
jgi:hypothetical protein